MLSRVYSNVFNFIKTKPLKLWAATWLSIAIIAGITLLGGAVPLLGVIAEIIMETAMLVIALKAIKGEEYSYSNLFDSCRSWESFGRVLGGNLWAALFVFLWGLIPIVGPVFAIIRAYEYRLVPYILVNEPEVALKDARNVSKERMMGYKWDMFTCDVVWIIAFIAALGIIALLSNIPVIGGLFVIINIILIVACILFGQTIACLINAQCYKEITSDK